ncbi:hypothetical protein ABTY98_41020 [Streptomyces sp. NPDC096040]|uniref:hypothetical protein n=1 Tax=Streptomyces sp. NPDC096040 TaxID=3155541 RepID=UPI00332B636F
MRGPEELHRVPWGELAHADGTAEDVPRHILALYLPDGEASAEALDELYGHVHGMGAMSESSAHTVPFLAHAAVHGPPGRGADVLTLLAVLADEADADFEDPPGGSADAVGDAVLREIPELLACTRDDDREVRRAVLRSAGRSGRAQDLVAHPGEKLGQRGPVRC